MAIKQPNIFKPFIDPLTGERYSLLGLKSFDQEFSFLDKDKNPKTLTVWVSFANHCYTRKRVPEEDPEEAVVVLERRSDGSIEERVFDYERWDFSQRLQAFIKGDLRDSNCLVGGRGELVYRHEKAQGAPLRTERGWYICGRFNVLTKRRKIELSIRSTHHRERRPEDIRNIPPRRFYNLISAFYDKNSHKIDG